jgi:hypothetical protein
LPQFVPLIVTHVDEHGRRPVERSDHYALRLVAGDGNTK